MGLGGSFAATPRYRLYSGPIKGAAVQSLLAIRQDACENMPWLAAKSLAHSTFPGYEYRFLISRIDISCIDFLFNIQKFSIHAICHNYPAYAGKLRPVLYDPATQKIGTQSQRWDIGLKSCLWREWADKSKECVARNQNIIFAFFEEQATPGRNFARVIAPSRHQYTTYQHTTVPASRRYGHPRFVWQQGGRAESHQGYWNGETAGNAGHNGSHNTGANPCASRQIPPWYPANIPSGPGTLEPEWSVSFSWIDWDGITPRVSEYSSTICG